MYPCILGRNWRNVEILAALTQRPIPGKFRLFSDLLTYWRKKQTYWTLMTGWLKLLTNCDKILNNVIWIHLGADAGRRAGYKNFSILCLRQDVRTDAVTHEILNTFNVVSWRGSRIAETWSTGIKCDWTQKDKTIQTSRHHQINVHNASQPCQPSYKWSTGPHQAEGVNVQMASCIHVYNAMYQVFNAKERWHYCKW